MNATNAITFTKLSQNSTSPKKCTPIILMTVNPQVMIKQNTQIGTSGNHKFKNVPAATASDAGPIKNANQYVYPVKNPK